MIMQNNFIKVIYDMETFNVEDIFCLALLLSFKEIDLKAVTLYPGTMEQVGVIRELFKLLNVRNCLIGGAVLSNKDRINNLAEKLKIKHGYNSSMVNDFYLNLLTWKKEYADDTQQNIINNLIKKNKKVQIISGAPLLNISNSIAINKEFKLDRLFIQGGFLGNNFENNILPDIFKEKSACYSFNLNEDYTSFEFIKNHSEQINNIVLVGRNITHQFNYDLKFHKEFFKLKDLNAANEFIYNGMNTYFHLHGKPLEWKDPLTAMILRETIKLNNFILNPKHPYTPIPVDVIKFKGKVREEIFSSINFHSNIFGIINLNRERIIKLNTFDNLYNNSNIQLNKTINKLEINKDDIEIS